jgi:hypothetical protein
MSEKKLGQEPAYPNTETYNPNNMECNCTFQIGMSKRLAIASKIAAGLASNEIGLSLARISERVPKNVKIAYEYADELLRQENDGI